MSAMLSAGSLRMTSRTSLTHKSSADRACSMAVNLRAIRTLLLRVTASNSCTMDKVDRSSDDHLVLVVSANPIGVDLY